ncbi:uncharacterized protein MELLADRAFT_114730, partial [Melampsora larici-populina 98AG31]
NNYEEGTGNVIDEDLEMQIESGSSDSEDDVELEGGWDGGLFSKGDIMVFRKLLRDVFLPSGIARLPPNLGEAKNGSLKAAQWHSLFAYIIPLIVVEIQWQRLLGNHSVVEEITVPSGHESMRDPGKNRYRIRLEEREYTALLKYAQVLNPEIRNYCQIPHPPEALILQPYAVTKASWKISKRITLSVLKPNNCIQYKNAGKTSYGLIRRIYQFQNIEHKWQTAEPPFLKLQVDSHRLYSILINISLSKLALRHYRSQNWLLFWSLMGHR